MLPDGANPFTLSVLRCLGAIKNINTHVVSFKKAPARFSRYCKSFTVIPGFMENDEPPMQFLEVCYKHKIDIILPTDIKDITYFIRNKQFFKDKIPVIPLSSLDNFNIANNKGSLTKLMIDEGILCPKTPIIKGNIQEINQLYDLNYPIIIKKTVSFGGNNIYVIESAKAHEEFKLKHRNAKDEFIVQEYIESGYDLDCNLFCREGEVLAHTIQQEVVPVSPEIRNFRSPGVLKFSENENVMHSIRQLMKKLQWSGFAHIDLRYDEKTKEFKILEINPRIWLSLLGSLNAGVNFPYIACMATLGLPFNVPKAKDTTFFMNDPLTLTGWSNHTRLRYSVKSSILYYHFKDPIPYFSHRINYILKKLLAGKF